MIDNDNIIDIEFHHLKIKKQIKANIKDSIIEIINKSNFDFLKNNNYIIIIHNKKTKQDTIIESVMTKEEKNNKKIKIILLPLNDEHNNKNEILCPECFEP